jgi:Ca2+/Na+ antiporter
MVFMTSARLTVFFRVILIVLLAFLSSMFRLEERYSFLSIVLTIVAGIFTGAVLANDFFQFWAFAFIYVIVFFLSCEVFEKNMLGV